MTRDHMAITAQIEKNMAEFKKIMEDHEAYLKQKADILEEAKSLGLELEAEIPWDELTDSQRKDLERIKIETERDLKDILGDQQELSRRRRPRGIPV